MSTPDDAAKHKIAQALQVLRQFKDLPAESINERSALVLLALIHLTPNGSWSELQRPLLGVTPIMEFIHQHYGIKYAPNSRETIRKATLHHFLHQTLVALNPDDPTRATNSPKNVYQIDSEFVAALQLLETADGTIPLQEFIERIASRQQRPQARAVAQIPVVFGDTTVLLSPSGQNPLIRAIIEDFCSRFAAGAEAVYVGDTSSKTEVFYNRELLSSLAVSLDDHGKMPDVIVYLRSQNWLFLIEAVTSHGAITATRLVQLQKLFGACTAGLVFVTAFESRATMRRYLADIAWETEVWIAESPEHLIHFNGDKFIGPRS
jgi:hypothetical protein